MCGFEIIVDEIIDLMGVLFTSPEEMIFSQSDSSNSMYFVASGTSEISQKFLSSKEKYFKKLAVSGDHFGEIGCLFNTARTCSVMSIDYNILARLTKQKFRMICSDYPVLHRLFMTCVYEYNDDQKQFVFNAFNKIDYLSTLNAFIFHSLMYQIKEFTIEQGELILKEGDTVKTIFIVKTGLVEVSVKFDGNEFVVARLEGGAIINSKAIFFKKAKSMITIR